LYDAVCLGPNIEKHAASPLYGENEIHPHPDYPYKRLKIRNLNKMMQRLKEEMYVYHRMEIENNDKNWMDFCEVARLPFECPKKIAFEKILALQDLDYKQQAMMFNSCIHSIYAAAKRQMKRAPTPDPIIADDFIQFAKEYITKHIGEYLKEFKYSFNQWFAHNEAKKQKDINRYLHALRNRADFTETEYKDLMTIKYKGICKQEVQPENGKPRMVCAIPIRTKTVMGPITWRLEEICAKHLPGYCGNKNLQQMTNMINDILDRGFTKIVEGDGSGFDNTQDVTLKEIDRWLYQQIADKIYHVPKEEFLYISQQIYKTMVVQYIEDKKKKNLFEYDILGSVFSGDCDTTLCNTIRMAMYNIYTNEKAGLKYGKDFIAISKGDDFTIFYKPYVPNSLIQAAYDKYFIRAENVDTSKPQIYGLGQILKFLTIGDASTISFCSLKAIYTDVSETKIILVRDFTKFDHISRYARKIKNIQGKQRVAYLQQQAISLRATYGGIEIFETMAQAFDLAAYQYAQYLAKGNEKLADKICYDSLKLVQKYIKYMKEMIPQESDILENEIDYLLYDIGKTKHFYQIQGDYWTTMKRLQEKVSYNLTKQEYDYINQEIDQIMSIHYFKAGMGLKI
jgi:hypothetical protein